MARPGLTGHRKFRRLARALGSPLLARGALELLWDSCYESGEDYVGTSDDIETLVGWTGERGMLTTALVEAGAPEGQGFLEPVSGAVSGGLVAYRVHDLWHHAPEYVAKRRKRELDRQEKADPKVVRQTAPNGGRWSETPDCQIEVDRTPSPSPSPSPSHKDTSATRQEPVEVRSVLAFPTIGTGPTTWQLSEAQVAEWATLFPGVAVLGECRKALAWVQASPGRRKTAKGMARFLVGWLSRVVDQRGARVLESAGSAAWRCPHDPPCGVGKTAQYCDLRTRLGRRPDEPAKKATA